RAYGHRRFPARLRQILQLGNALAYELLEILHGQIINQKPRRKRNARTSAHRSRGGAASTSIGGFPFNFSVYSVFFGGCRAFFLICAILRNLRIQKQQAWPARREFHRKRPWSPEN